jgi:hypothetical protein
LNNTLLYIGATIVFLWGVGHLIPTKSIVSGFGNVSADNKYIITMEWLMEGLTLCFIGLLVFVVAVVGDAAETVSRTVLGLTAGMLIVMAAVSLRTGARSSILPMKLCPWVKTTVALLLVLEILL